MLDPVQLPILMKAIDFVFDEGRKILEERRERRKHEDHPSEAESPELVKEVQPFMIENAVVVKQDLLASKIDEIPWQNNEAEIQHVRGWLADALSVAVPDTLQNGAANWFRRSSCIA